MMDTDLSRHALERVRKSGEFRRSPGLRRFLAFLVDAALEHHTDEIKEPIIGVEVLHRALGCEAKATP